MDKNNFTEMSLTVVVYTTGVNYLRQSGARRTLFTLWPIVTGVGSHSANGANALQLVSYGANTYFLWTPQLSWHRFVHARSI